MKWHSVRSAAIAVDAPLKWLDNLLSHHGIAGVVRTTRGVERQLDDAGLLAIALTRALAVDLGVPLALGASIASRIAGEVDANAALHRYSLPSGLVLEVPVAAIVRRTSERVSDATEAVAHIKRGRPVTRKGRA